MSVLQDLGNRSIYVVKEAYAEFKKPAVLWSMGNNDTAAFWLRTNVFSPKFAFR